MPSASEHTSANGASRAQPIHYGFIEHRFQGTYSRNGARVSQRNVFNPLDFIGGK
jgi:hypothetical protein